MPNSASAMEMLSFIHSEVPRLFVGTTFQTRSMDDAAVYEAYIYTCIVVAVERVKAKKPGKIRWELVPPPGFPNQLVLRKKACSISSATGVYSYIHIQLDTKEYELHTDTPALGRSGVLNELDIALVRAEACADIRNARRGAPQSTDVALLVEAKCYTSALPLGIGRAFLGLYRDEFKDTAIGYLVSTADNDSIFQMLSYHTKSNWSFFQRLDDRVSEREGFISTVSNRILRLLRNREKTSSSSQTNGAPIKQPSQMQVTLW